MLNQIAVTRGQSPLIVSVPHAGTIIDAATARQLRDPQAALQDTDWRVDQLYDVARELDATIVATGLSRIVVDVNRDPSGASLYPGQATTGLVPVETFSGETLYPPGREPASEEIANRRALGFAPYHEALAAEIARLRGRHDHLLLYDAHSIRSVVPRLFPGTLPVFNIGSNGGRSAAPGLVRALVQECAATGESLVLDGRFRGGWITRHYGRPETGVHAIQMELAQRFYLDEDRPLVQDSQLFGRARTIVAALLQSLLRALD